QRALANGAPAPQRLEEDVVAPFDGERDQENDASAETAQAAGHEPQREQEQRQDEKETDLDDRVEQPGQRTPRGARGAMPEPDVLRCLDVSRGIERVQYWPEPPACWR